MTVLQGKLVQIWLNLSYAVIFGIIKIVQCFLRFTVAPFSKGTCQKLENYLFLPACQYLVFLLDWWSNVRLILHTDGEAKDNLFGKENAICFMNTQNNFLQKLIMAKLGDNFNMVQHCDNNVFESNTGNHFQSDKYTTFRQIGGNQYWCVLFPEYNYSTPKCTVCGDIKHMRPKFATFQKMLSLDSNNPYDAIYDLSLVVVGDLTNCAMRNVFDQRIIDVNVYLKRIPIDEMPEEESEQEIFLNELDEEKKFSLHEFLENGEFLECQTGINIIEQYEFEPSVRSAVSFGVCSTITLIIVAMIAVLCCYKP